MQYFNEEVRGLALGCSRMGEMRLCHDNDVNIIAALYDL